MAESRGTGVVTDMGEVVDRQVSVAVTELGADELRQWAYRCVDGLTDRREEINELNVFPIPDSDTGTNLVFTVRSAVECMRSAGPDADLAAVASSLARGAVAGARGNSGVIVSQVMRALAEECRSGRLDGPGVARVLGRASNLVVEVVSVPVEGTIVTVLAVAAEAAAEPAGSDLASVVHRASESASMALDRTRSQLSVLDAAGVVDAGALGLVIMLDCFSAVVTGTLPTRPRYHRAIVASHPTKFRSVTDAEHHHHGASSINGYEVLYRVTDIGEDDVVALRSALTELGDSTVVAGDGEGSWSVHVHTANAGLAVEVGLDVGRVHDIRIDALSTVGCVDGLSTTESNDVHGRDILAVVAGDGAEQLYVGEGAAVLRCDTRRIGTAELCDAILRSEHSEVLVLPNGALSAQELVSVSIASRTAGKEVLMLPSSSMVQGLAALAVHDPSRAAVDDAFAMSEAAAGTRWASLRIANEISLTWVGMCEPGNGLGLAGREVVVIGQDVLAAGRALLDQLLSVGGEMVTMLHGEPVAGHPDPADVVEGLSVYVADRHPGIEVVVYAGGQPGDVVQLGVE